MSSAFGTILSTTQMLNASDISSMIHRISTASPVNGLATGATLIGTTENAGRDFYPLMAVVVANSVSGFVSSCALSIGTNGALYNNVLILSAGALAGLSAAGQMLNIPITSAVARVAPNTGIHVNVTSLAVATTFNFHVHLLGFYQ